MHFYSTSLYSMVSIDGTPNPCVKDYVILDSRDQSLVNNNAELRRKASWKICALSLDLKVLNSLEDLTGFWRLSYSTSRFISIVIY